jgi:hypothetical protein
MIKLGDRVHPIFEMGKLGTVIDIKQADTSTWMVGGAMSQELVAVVKLDKDGTINEYRYSDLMCVS